MIQIRLSPSLHTYLKTSLKTTYRVKADEEVGLYTEFRQSGIFTVFVLTELLHNTRNSTVYSGYLDADPDRALVFKFGASARIWDEASYYHVLADLENKVIPPFIGAGSARDSEWGWLALERYGTPIRDELAGMYFEEKADLLNRLQVLHDEGFVHNDFQPCNILEGDDGFRIIDFDNMIDEHRCKYRHLDWNTFPKMTCKYMYRAARGMWLWDDGRVCFSTCPYWPVEKVPSSRIMDRTYPAYYIDKYRGNENAQNVLFRRYFERVRELLDKKEETLESIQSRIPALAKEIEDKYAENPVPEEEALPRYQPRPNCALSAKAK